ncbi:hypothetical protein PTNB85_06952 [Pyrenophora teres f. teres]|uniref:Fucose-specific lectin n=1 Tax=Pyrenophora teres f. teres TaxID=97479 RepID=A0A6S6WFL7_9PLEO|nr:hypothetical protein HRS9139_08215 [Pyrenophora teres f. teres]KAE8832560.1 hypothetical protein PTNB85_06952 [Pyrenophora teres f. teres]KAE8856222.1 hypothetical protein PTNB29_09061 [Pyrenophora teres f. teres]CAE7214206.1 hypothetical protein PTTW11_10517 [Pyrenophora teres f. teres]
MEHRYGTNYSEDRVRSPSSPPLPNFPAPPLPSSPVSPPVSPPLQNAHMYPADELSRPYSGISGSSVSAICTSPPLPEKHVYGKPVPQELPTNETASYGQMYSTEKETPQMSLGTPMYMSMGTPTPDFSAPEVVPGQFNRSASYATTGDEGVAPPYGRPYGFKEHVDSYDGPEAVAPQPSTPTAPNEITTCGMKKWSFSILVVFIAIAVLVLALGLGLGLGLRKIESNNGISAQCREKTNFCVGGALKAEYLSKRGVFNGTGIALAGESWNRGQRRIFTLYFQHHTGDIRFMQYTTDRKWIGGSKAQTVAYDAKPATPISAVSFAINQTQYFHIFYITTANKVAQITQSNVSSIWTPGPLNALNLTAYDAPTVGLQACWKGNFYGDNDFTRFPTFSGLENTQPFVGSKGMNIWFPIDAHTFQQYAWYSGQENDTWVPIQQWKGFNAHAGVGCYSWGQGSTTYAMFSNEAKTVEVWWKDTNASAESTDTHPINSWQNATKAAIPNVYPITSLGYTTYFYAQMADRTIRGYNISFASENTQLAGEDSSFAITDPAGPVQALGGTHLTLTAFAEKDGERTLWDSLYVFFQTEGDDITAFTRGLNGGEWTRGKLGIPDD